MKKYAKVINKQTGLCEVGLGSNEQFYRSIGMKELDVRQSDIDGNWYLAYMCPMKTDEEKEQEEKERIARLSCTKRDFALMLQEMGVDYFTTLKPLIESNPQAQLEWELCERLYRFNPMLDLMASQMGVTSEQLDGLFKYANGEITLEEFRALKSVEEPTETPVDPQEDQDTSELESVDDPSLTHEAEVFNLEE